MDDRNGYNKQGYRDPTPQRAIIRDPNAKKSSAVYVPRVTERTEQDEQIAVLTWAYYMTGKWPCLERLYHTPNGGYRNQAEAVQLKRMGVKPGVPDLHLPYPAGGYHGIWLEMKTEKGKVTAVQRDWIEYLRSVGYRAYVCHNTGEAINALETYLKMEHETLKDKVARLERELAAAKAELNRGIRREEQ